MLSKLLTKSMKWNLRGFGLYLSVVFFGYFGLVVSRLSGSSMGLLSDSGEGLVIGANRPIRSDEYLRSTPMEIGAINHPLSPGVSLLSSEGFDEPGLDEFELLRPERLIIDLFLGGEFAFSAIWWTPALLVLIGVPLLLRQFNLPLKISIALSLIIIFSPAVVWWSNGIAGIIGRLSLGVALVIMASASKGWRVWVFTFVGGWIASGVAMDYQPWSIIASLFFFPLVVFFIFKNKSNSLPMILSGLLSLLPLVYFIFSKMSVFQVISATLYPGQRRVTSGLVNAWNWSLSGPQQWSLLNPDGILYSNQSEISMGYFLFIFPALFYAYSSIRGTQKFGVREVVLGSYLVIASWSFISYPDIPFNPLTVVSPERGLAMVTAMAPLVFGLLYANRLSESIKDGNKDFHLAGKSDMWARIALAVFVTFITFGSAVIMEGVVLNFSTRIAFMVAVLCGVITFMIISPNSAVKGVWAFTVFAIFVSGPVNPVSHGTAPLTDSSLARVLNTLETTGAWASDGIHLDAVLMANGKPSISGQQLTGPDEEQWRLLDPQGSYEQVWNAGASFVVVAWDSAIKDPEITRPFPDTILIRTSPCSPALKKLDLEVVLSRTEESAPCLAEFADGPVDYLGAPVYLYEVTN